MNFNKCIHLRNRHPDKNLEHFHHSRKCLPLMKNSKNDFYKVDGNSLSEKFNNQLCTISSGNWTEVNLIFFPAVFPTTKVNVEH